MVPFNINDIYLTLPFFTFFNIDYGILLTILIIKDKVYRY